MDFTLSQKTQQYLERLVRFMKERIDPIEAACLAELKATCVGGDWATWRVPAVIEELKAQAKREGLWNLFLPDPHHGAGLSTLEYATLAEQMGKSAIAAEIFNCNAPDTGNMEVLHQYGSKAQQAQWLTPLLAGEIRSVFCMTEPAVASSDATNMQATAVVEGDEVVLNGQKWWSTGLGDPRAKIAIFMARTPNPSADRHHQHSMVLVPLNAKGVEIRRMLSVFGAYDPPSGHGEVHFTNVRVPVTNIIGAPGMGFEIAQGRLGPGRIHHCMRCIGAAEKVLELMVARGQARTAFGKPLLSLGGNRQLVAEARIAIDQARLLTLYAAWKLDELGALGAMTEISAIKVVAPSMLQKIVDDAIQLHGGAGVSEDFPLTAYFAMARSLRLADGPDEVHKGLIAKLEIARHAK